MNNSRILSIGRGFGILHKVEVLGRRYAGLVVIVGFGLGL